MRTAAAPRWHTVFRLWLILFGVVCIGIGLAHLLFGPATIIGGGPVSATVDSELRFYAVLFMGFGAAFIWAARDIAQRGGVVNALGVLFLLGGLARFLAWWQSGPPHWFFIAMIAVEIVIPAVNWLAVTRIRSDRVEV